MTNETKGADEFNWQPLGESRWRELAQSAGASELQLRFAVAKFSGATATAAARMAGYSGDKDSLRRAGYAAARSTAVANLIELASVNAPVDARLTEKELDARLAKLCRSSDPNISLKREAALRARGEPSSDDLLRDRPDLFWAGWLEKLGPKRGPAVVSLLGWYSSSGGKGTDAFQLAPFLDALLPHVKADWPDIFNFLCADYPENDWQRQTFPEAANKPPMPVAEIVANVKARYERLDNMETNNAA